MAILCPPAQSFSDSSTLQVHVSWTHSKREKQEKHTTREGSNSSNLGEVGNKSFLGDENESK